MARITREEWEMMQQQQPPSRMAQAQGMQGFVPTQVRMGASPSVTYENPTIEAQKSAQVESVKEEQKLNLKRRILAKDLEIFSSIDKAIPRGEGFGRFVEGGKSAYEGFSRQTPRGQAVGAYDASKKRLRVQLVRAAGDVGNINIVEQQAAEKLIPEIWDDEKTAEIKRAYLRDITQEINSNSGSEVKGLINKFMTEHLGGNKAMQEQRKPLSDPNIATQFLKQAGYDNQKATELARQAGYD